jgi:hypothetical protein
MDSAENARARDELRVLSDCENALMHLRASHKQFMDSIGQKPPFAKIDETEARESELKFSESINHLERAYQALLQDRSIGAIVRDIESFRPPRVDKQMHSSRSEFFGSTLGNLLSHYRERFEGEKREKSEKLKKREKLIWEQPVLGSVVVYAVGESGKRIGFESSKVNEMCVKVMVVSSGNFRCEIPWDGYDIRSIEKLVILPDDAKKRAEEEEEEEEEEEDRDREKRRETKRAKTGSAANNNNNNNSWTDGPSALKKIEDAFKRVSLRKKTVNEIVDEQNEKKAFEKFTKMARERARKNIEKYCGADGKTGAAIVALAMLFEWFEDFHVKPSKKNNTNKNNRNDSDSDSDELEADPRSCGVEVPKRYLPQFYKDSKTKFMTYQDLEKAEDNNLKKISIGNDILQQKGEDDDDDDEEGEIK